MNSFLPSSGTLGNNYGCSINENNVIACSSNAVYYSSDYGNNLSLSFGK